MFFAVVWALTATGAAAVFAHRPVPPPSTDPHEMQTLIDLTVTEGARNLGWILKRVQVGEIERRDDGSALVAFTASFSHPRMERPGYALLVHGWHVAGFGDDRAALAPQATP